MFDLDAPFELGAGGATGGSDRADGAARRTAPAARRPARQSALAAGDRSGARPAGAHRRSPRTATGFTLTASPQAKPLFKVARGTAVTLSLVNQTPTPQTLRLDGHVARILHALDDGWDPYWRDALYIPPGARCTRPSSPTPPGAGRWLQVRPRSGPRAWQAGTRSPRSARPTSRGPRGPPPPGPPRRGAVRPSRRETISGHAARTS